MPLDAEYFDLIKSDVADIKNTGGQPAGSITAAKFLERFAGDTPWAHMDIAGTFLASGNWKYFRPGATGVMVRTIAALARSMAG